MNSRFCVDVCLSKKWTAFLSANGYPSVNWRDIASNSATDLEFIYWAISQDRIVLTEDYDFAGILAMQKCNKPSVVQLVEPFIMPDSIGQELLDAIVQYESDLNSGALLIVEKTRIRLYGLPFP